MIQQAVHLLKQCEVLVIGAGAGMGRDSGLPDFRGDGGFWNNYPPYRNKFNFYDCANPNFLEQHPHLFWGFYGSRLAMYREKQPHQGFNLIKEIARNMSKNKGGENLFVVTSNVDGHFEKAGFSDEQVYECHGSIHHLQCVSCDSITPNHFQPEVDYEQMSCRNMPKCQQCNQVQRPNILMFGDWGWNSQRSAQQEKRYQSFLKKHENSRIGIVQIGCGSAVPTIRNMMEQLYFISKESKLIRINPDRQESSAKWLDPHRYIDLTCGAQEGIGLLHKAFIL